MCMMIIIYGKKQVNYYERERQKAKKFINENTHKNEERVKIEKSSRGKKKKVQVRKVRNEKSY